MAADAAGGRARLYLATGDLASASAEQDRAASGELRPYSRSLERLGRARLLIARDEPKEALQLLLEHYEAAKTSGAKIPILILQALALRTLGERERAVGVLAEALALAEPEGYVRTFVDEGKPMAELLSMMVDPRRGGRPDVAGSVPASFPRKLLATLEREAAAGLPEPLSERELEVLALVAAGETNRQISSELFVSVGTVKTHLNNLYRKLETHSRTQAVARARELGLI
jgi:LuxR family maltose regulon positive regulatory protein